MTVRVAIMTVGSRGDVAPYTGLAEGLVRAGHDVTLVTHARFEPLVARSAIRFHPLPIDPHAELLGARGQSLNRSRTGPGKLARVMKMARELAGEMADDLVRAAQAADMLLLSGSVAPLGYAIADALGLPSIGLNLQPLHPTAAFVSPMAGVGTWGGPVNRAVGHGVHLALSHVYAPAAREAGRLLGVPARGLQAQYRERERGHWPVLYGYSPLVVPRPRDWRQGLEVTGYWWPRVPDPRLPARLLEFLDAGPPPVFVGLGSATVPDPARVSGEIVRALRAAGLRGVLQEGWAGLHADDDDIITVGDVPHSALFPRLAAVVHHAGAGTTGAGLRAGIPAVPVPIQFDAGFWSDRLVRLGVAPRALPLRRLTAARLASALKEATGDPAYRLRARSLAGRIADEDGIEPVLAAVNRA
ncbi:glycosyltransferase [Streptomyces sp. NBC_00083]|uniref:glycosyltransferase n=1 Tax=Streptomyces sp. NBC_00083 TaxID=2975647 RepID=UPI002252C326|nr:glycosyltransferase [Streptomyces sp. NBC_00083]MCX5384161.1 glycosyltransferase [Streptomyces sp. NBC_00083]